MSDFRALKGFMDKVCEAGEPFGETRKDYFFKCVHLPTFKQLGMEVVESYHAAEEELVVNLDKLGDDKRKAGYLREAKAILFESLDLANFLQLNSRLMLEVLTESEEVGQGSIEQRAFLQMSFTVNLHWKDDLRHDPAFPTLPISSRERIALCQIVGTGAYEGWQKLNDEVDRQLRLVQDGLGSPVHDKNHTDEPSFNLKEFMNSVKIEAEIIKLFDGILEEMNAIVKDSAGAYKTIRLDSKGTPFIAVYRLLIAFKKLDAPKPGELQLWVSFFQGYYRAHITEGVSKYHIASAQSKWFRLEVKRAYQLITNRMPGLKRVYHLPAIYQ